MSATQKVTTHFNWIRCYSSIGVFTSNYIPFSSFVHFKNRTLLYLFFDRLAEFKEMLIFFNISGSEQETHSVQTTETYFPKEHIHQRSVQIAHFIISL